MQSNRNPNSQAIPERIPIQPLTHHIDGRVYQRLTLVEKQIEDALMLAPSELIEHAKEQNYHAPGYLQEECLVYLIREYHRQGKTDLMNMLAEALLRRRSRHIREKLRRLPPQDQDEAFQDVLNDLFSQIVDLVLTVNVRKTINSPVN